eukprot:scaffold117761_cov75-Phaeocystis_antarctica.AAC.3
MNNLWSRCWALAHRNGALICVYSVETHAITINRVCVPRHSRAYPLSPVLKTREKHPTFKSVSGAIGLFLRAPPRGRDARGRGRTRAGRCA